MEDASLLAGDAGDRDGGQVGITHRVGPRPKSLVERGKVISLIFRFCFVFLLCCVFVFRIPW